MRRGAVLTPQIGGSGPPGSPFAWYDASDLASLTVAATFVTQMNDKSGNGHTLTPLGSGLTPGPTSGIATVNSLNALTGFAGALAPVGLASAAFSQAQPIIIYAVAQFQSAAPAGAQIVGNDSVTPTIFVSSGDVSLYAGSVLMGTVGPDTAHPHVYGATFNGASSTLLIDGATAASGNPGTSGFSTKRILIGTDGTATAASELGATSEFCEALFYTTDPGGVRAYLKAKWGTP